MPTEEMKSHQLVGCLGACAYLLLCLPLWYCLLFGILFRIDTPVWMWVAYWLYVPSSVSVALLEKLANHLWPRKN